MAGERMDDDAARFIDTVLADRDQPVVIFALEWCEFCWSLRKFLSNRAVPFRSVDLDSVAMQEQMLGRRIRDELTGRTTCATIPQVFVAGEFIGGCTDVLDGWKEGSIQPLLRRAGVGFRDAELPEPRSFLPGWIHPR